MTQSRLELEDYTLRVLDVIKGKYGLKNRSEALNKFAQEYGEEFVEQPFKEEVIKSLEQKYQDHRKNFGNRTMTLKELDDLLNKHNVTIRPTQSSTKKNTKTK